MKNINARVIVFSRIAKWRNFSCYFTKKFFHFSAQSQKTFPVESVFSLVVGKWIGQLELLKRNANKDVSSDFSKSFQTFYFTNPVALVKKLRYRPLSCKFPIILAQRKHLFWSLFVLNSEILECRLVTLEKKGQFCKKILEIFENLEHCFLS